MFEFIWEQADDTQYESPMNFSTAAEAAQAMAKALEDGTIPEGFHWAQVQPVDQSFGG